jgi:hypothetical protein
MRTIQQMLAEIEVRKALGMPRIELTQEERVEAFGDTQQRDPDAYTKMMVERFKQGLPLSVHDKRQARKFIKEQQHG